MSNPPTEMVKVYRCWFDDPGGNRRCTDIPRGRGIASFREGLWVNDEWQWTNFLDYTHWIPPSRLVLVTVLEVEA